MKTDWKMETDDSMSGNDDSREKLEEDVYRAADELDAFYCGERFLDTRKIIGWLDRQAAITRAELVDCASCPITERNAEFAGLEAERDEWKTKCETYEVAYKQADAERKRYSEQIDGLFAERDELQAKLDAYDETHMLLPVDSDGVPWHIGDRVQRTEHKDRPNIVTGIELYSDGRHKLHVRETNCTAWTPYANEYRHVKPRTIEDVLRGIVELAQYPSASQIDDGDIESFADEIRELMGSDGA